MAAATTAIGTTAHARLCIDAALWFATELPSELINIIIDYVNPCKIVCRFGSPFLAEHFWVVNARSLFGFDRSTGIVLFGGNFKGNATFALTCTYCGQERVYPLPL